MFFTPSLNFITKREINENNQDPLLDVDALLIDDDWELLKRSENHAVYRKAETEYDIIDILYKKTSTGEHTFSISLSLLQRNMHTQLLSGTKQMFEYMCNFIEHYSQERAHKQHLEANRRYLNYRYYLDQCIGKIYNLH